MKAIQILITSLSVMFLSVLIYPQDSFEGKVGYKITSGDETTVMNYLIKDNFIKMDVEAEEGASMIFNTKDHTMIVIMPSQQMYMEMPVDMAGENMAESERLKGEFKQTGEEKEILGYTCEKWVYTDDENVIESWMTKELGSFIFAMNPMDQEGSKPEWQAKLEKGGYFPMSVIVKETAESDVTTMEVTSVEKVSLDKEMFTPPAGYQKLEIPGMK